MRVQVVNEVRENEANHGKQWNLCFQWCNYIYDDGSIEQGYRFIWRRPDGSMQPARGQARIPSIKRAESLIQKAKQQGWGDHEAD